MREKEAGWGLFMSVYTNSVLALVVVIIKGRERKDEQTQVRAEESNSSLLDSFPLLPL